MQFLINQIIGIIEEECENPVNQLKLIKLEDFNSPVIYMEICKHFSEKRDNGEIGFVGLIDNKKYDQFVAAKNSDWKAALDYLKTNAFYRQGVPLTNLRNNCTGQNEKTTLHLLMGTETASDRNSLGEFYGISMTNLVNRIQKNYSYWFAPFLSSIEANTEEAKRVINNIYKAIFIYNNVNLFELSVFIDDLANQDIRTLRDLVEHIFKTLNKHWNMPSIKSDIPGMSALNKYDGAKIIRFAFEFINNKLSILKAAKIKSIPQLLEEYAEKNSIDQTKQFETFNSYTEFGNALIDFIDRKEVDTHRREFMGVDFGVVNAILDLKPPKDQSKKTKEGEIRLTGDPLDAYLQIITQSCDKFKEKFGGKMPQTLVLQFVGTRLSNCDEDSRIDQFSKICTYLGGLAGFINSNCLSAQSIALKYQEDFDPFEIDNIEKVKERIKPIAKLGSDSEIIFKMTAIGQANNEKTACEFKWVFSPYANWKESFALLKSINDSDKKENVLPLLLHCGNMADFINCESENEFFIKFESISWESLGNETEKLVHDAFKDTVVCEKFDSLCSRFNDWCCGILKNGFFNQLDSMNNVIGAYREMIKATTGAFGSFSSLQREKLPALTNCFTIISGKEFAANEAIIPAYNPAMLEKINSQNFYKIFCLIDFFKDPDSFDKKKLENIKQLTDIAQPVEIIPLGVNDSIACRNVWGYYAVYYKESSKDSFTGSFDIPEEQDADGDRTNDEPSLSNIIERNINDYLKTFPARGDGLNVCFIAPKEIRSVVSGIGRVANFYSKNHFEITINIKIICYAGAKNVNGYLRFWLDSYMSEEKSVKINAFIKYINSEKDLEAILENQDICFIYDILETGNIVFNEYSSSASDNDERCRFPMTFVPDTITATHGNMRRINISQMQFPVSAAYTQLAHKIIEPNSMEREYKIMQQLSLQNKQQTILKIAHEKCRWVVCEDKAIDRALLQSSGIRIIGFTTGEGSFGEYNVTVSAKEQLVNDVKKLLKVRLAKKFNRWSSEMSEKAAENCIALTESFDGSRILKALNPYDYEIHNFLAYTLIVKELGIAEPIDGKYICRNLISMDSYQHWFKDNRPDFMLLEIPDTPDCRRLDEPIKIKIKIIECKMGDDVKKFIGHAQEQVKSGIDTMKPLWNSKNTSIDRRYWFTQLYRAIVFSRLGISDSDPDYSKVYAKLYDIISGRFEIEWTGDIYAYDLKSESDSSETETLEEYDITLHKAGQLYIQKMLLPEELQNENLQYSSIEDHSETGEDMAKDSDASDEGVENFPKLGDIMMPFLKMLSSGSDCSRADALNWFKDYFKLDESLMKVKYESNDHLKWETILDSAITYFRKNGIIENRSYGIFHITELGLALNKRVQELGAKEITASLIAQINSASDISDTVPDPITPSSDDTAQMVQEIISSNQAAKEPAAAVSSTPAEAPAASVSPTATAVKKPLSEVRILLGEDSRGEKYYWEFGNNELNNRHLLINGNSGCGKTYCIQCLLMEAAMQGISSIVFDYTGGFTNSKLDSIFKDTLGDKIKQRIIRNDKMPVNPFGKHEIQIDEDLFVPENNVDIASKIAEIFATVYKFGDQQRSAVYSAVLSGLEKHGDDMNFKHMINELKEANAQSVISKIREFTDMDPFEPNGRFSWADIRDSDGMVYVIQLMGYNRDVQVLMTELMLWDIWSFSVKTGDESKPMILVLDEAQNISHGEKSPSAKILTEGRKFGLSGWYATQFMKPQLTDDEIQRLQQAGQKLYFCPPESGANLVAKNIDITPQGAKDWAERLGKLKKGECVTCGSMVKGDKWAKYQPKVIKVTSLQDRLNNS